MDFWEKCVEKLKGELSPQLINMWVIPLQASFENGKLKLFAPNQFVMDWVENNFFDRIREVAQQVSGDESLPVAIMIGSKKKGGAQSESRAAKGARPLQKILIEETDEEFEERIRESKINRNFTFDTFVEGKSNQIARAASYQIGCNPGKAYNPLFIYGGVGLGKTHLMHAVGNTILRNSPGARVVYLHSERFVTEMVKALQHNRIDEFKRHYRSVNALLIDDVQFFAGKERSQEEFFHTFNALFESEQQIVLSSDRFPKEVKGLEERLRSRFGWGLTVAIEPPDLETRVAILQKKALQLNMELATDVAFFIGKKIRSNIRELEGALRRLIANADFTGKTITVDFARVALKDMFAAQEKLVTIENIQKEVAEYYQIRTSDLLSSKRSRSIARPRQIAMTLAKELTSHSLPEIGAGFGGRDHTTVLHANRKVKELRETDPRISEDYSNLLRILSS